VSGCHGDLLACKYGQHAPCDNSHMAVLQQGFPFVRFLFYGFGHKVFICLYSWCGIVLSLKRFTVLVYFYSSVFIYIYFVVSILISHTFYVRDLSCNKIAVSAPRVLKLCTWGSVLLEKKKFLWHVGYTTETFIFHLIEMNFIVPGGL